MTVHIRVTKHQHLMVCTMHNDSPYMSYKELAGLARKKFGITKPPGKSTIMRIIKGAA